MANSYRSILGSNQIVNTTSFGDNIEDISLSNSGYSVMPVITFTGIGSFMFEPQTYSASTVTAKCDKGSSSTSNPTSVMWVDAGISKSILITIDNKTYKGIKCNRFMFRCDSTDFSAISYSNIATKNFKVLKFNSESNTLYSVNYTISELTGTASPSTYNMVFLYFPLLTNEYVLGIQFIN